MSFEDEFDRIIRQKSEEAAFPFDEKNWQKVSAQLDTQRRPAGFWITKKLSIAVVALLILLGSSYFIMRETAVVNPSLAQNSNKLNSTEAKADPAPQDNIVKTEQAQVKDLESPVIDNDIKNELSPTVSGKKENSSRDKVEKTITAVSGIKKSESHGLNNNGSSEIKMQSTKNNKAARSVIATELPATNENVEKQVAEAKDKTISEASNNNNTNNSALSSIKVTTEAKDNALIENDQEDFAAEKSMYPELFEAFSMRTIQTNLPQDQNEQSLLPSPFVMLTYLDDDYYKKKNFKKHYLNVEVGSTYLFGWQSKKETDGKGFNWFAGINYGRYVTNKMSISAGVQFYNISNIKNPFYSHSNTSFGFGATITTTIITATSLYYAAIPLKFAYKVNANNQIGLGVNVGFLMAASKNVETFTFSEYGKTDISNNKGLGAYRNIAGTNLLLSAFYKTQLNKRLALNGEIMYGLTDLFKNTMTITNSEKATGIRISLQYTLFDK